MLPNLGSALLAGGMLAFALSFDEIIVTTFTAGHERTLPLWLLNQLGRPRDVPVTNVVALLVMLVTTIPILGASVANPRRRKHCRQREITVISTGKCYAKTSADKR